MAFRAGRRTPDRQRASRADHFALEACGLEPSNTSLASSSVVGVGGGSPYSVGGASTNALRIAIALQRPAAAHSAVRLMHEARAECRPLPGKLYLGGQARFSMIAHARNEAVAGKIDTGGFCFAHPKHFVCERPQPDKIRRRFRIY